MGTLFIQAAKVLMMRPQNRPKVSFGPWLANAAPRIRRETRAAALANKLARIDWSVLSTSMAFDPHQPDIEAV